jgi:hypothetical protein
MNKKIKEVNKLLEQFYKSYYGEIVLGDVIKFKKGKHLWKYGMEHFPNTGYGVVTEIDTNDDGEKEYQIIVFDEQDEVCWYDHDQLELATRQEISQLINQGYKIRRGYLGE